MGVVQSSWFLFALASLPFVVSAAMRIAGRIERLRTSWWRKRWLARGRVPATWLYVATANAFMGDKPAIVAIPLLIAAWSAYNPNRPKNMMRSWARFARGGTLFLTIFACLFRADTLRKIETRDAFCAAYSVGAPFKAVDFVARAGGMRVTIETTFADQTKSGALRRLDRAAVQASAERVDRELASGRASASLGGFERVGCDVTFALGKVQNTRKFFVD